MKKKLLIAGYPKSGNTWLGYMLSYILGAQYVDLHSPDTPPTNQKHTLELLQRNISPASTYSHVHKTHERYSYINSSTLPIDSYDSIIHLVRDIRDVTVSYYYFHYYNLPLATNTPEKILAHKNWFVRQFYWKKTVYSVARDWLFHTMGWHAFQGARLVKYEDLHANTFTCLENICRDLECDYSRELLEETIQAFSFESLSGGRKAGEEYSAAFFRKGIIGDYQNHFDIFDTLIMKHYCAHEMKQLAYTV